MKWNRIRMKRGPWYAMYLCHICDHAFSGDQYEYTDGVCPGCGTWIRRTALQGATVRNVTATHYFLGLIPWKRSRYRIRLFEETEAANEKTLISWGKDADAELNRQVACMTRKFRGNSKKDGGGGK